MFPFHIPELMLKRAIVSKVVMGDLAWNDKGTDINAWEKSLETASRFQVGHPTDKISGRAFR